MVRSNVYDVTELVRNVSLLRTVREMFEKRTMSNHGKHNVIFYLQSIELLYVTIISKLVSLGNEI